MVKIWHRIQNWINALDRIVVTDVSMLPWNQRGKITVACLQYATDLLNEPDVFNLEYHPAPTVLAKQIRMIPELAKALALK
jgi:hypothetical protein